MNATQKATIKELNEKVEYLAIQFSKLAYEHRNQKPEANECKDSWDDSVEQHLLDEANEKLRLLQFELDSIIYKK